MPTAGVSELKARISQYLAAVEAGEEVLITDRGRPVARLVGPAASPGGAGQEEAGRLGRLVRSGVVRPASGEIPESFWRVRRGQDADASVRRALLDERANGR